jgi:hypothetical protein
MSHSGGVGLEQITLSITVPDIEVVDLGEAVIEVVSDTTVGPRGRKGDKGDAGPPGGSYVHTQDSPALVWTVQHNLGIYPSGVEVQDADGNAVEGIVTYVSLDILLITFYAAIAGIAFIS